MSVAEDLQRLQQLHDSGAIDDDEYATAKRIVLNPSAADRGDSAPGSSPMTADDEERRTRSWAALLHLSMVLGTVVPYLGFVIPILVWQYKRGELPGLDEHGRNAANWIISSIIYFAICAILVLVIIGLPMLIGLMVCNLVFPIIAAGKAGDGEAWKYPFAIEFLGPDEKW
jgi:uncharacterized Tic20 family protein